MTEKQYASRDIRALGKHYTTHVEAMTAEGLHAKSAIAAELAHRDAEIERLNHNEACVLALLAYMDSDYADNALDLLRLWMHGEWNEIRTSWPDFDFGVPL